MLVEPHPQTPFSDKNQRISPIIDGIVRERAWNQITGIYAYSTARGLLELLGPIESLSPLPSLRWLFGLDDCLTEPGAIKLALSVGGVVRIASLVTMKRRFHPKVLHFAGSDRMCDVAIIGSANLTLSGLTTNAEAVSILRTESSNDVDCLRRVVSELFNLGHEPTPLELKKYRQAYKAARPHHSKVAQLTRRISRPSSKTGKATKGGNSETVSPGLDPTIATRCWIEVGKNTAQGRELEIKSEQALFFDLHHSAGDKQARKFALSDGSTASLNFKYQGNAMWRLQMRNDVPEVRRGLRPRTKDGGLGRSPYVAVFERTKTKHLFTLTFVHEKSSDYRRIRRDAQMTGTTGRTTTRRFGWS